MHPRHRNLTNGYRSSPVGMRGISVPSRIAPESSIRGGHGMFNSEFRNYSPGFGRGHPRPPPNQVAPPPPQRRSDIFAEAGRLATEYLVSKGVLPQDVLTGKWQIGSLKNQMGNFRGFRQQDGDNLPHHRSRNGSDSGSSRRRQSDEYVKPDGWKIHSQDKSKSKSNGSDLDREMGRSNSLSEKASSNLDTEEKGIDSEAGNVGQNSSQSTDVKPTSDVTVESQSVVDNFHNRDDMASDGKDLRVETGVELSMMVDDIKPLAKDTADPKDGRNSCQVEKQSGVEEAPMHDCAAEDEPVNHSSGNLLSLCSFSKVPTKTRSMRGSKGDLVPIAEEEKYLDVSQRNNRDDGSLGGSEVVFKDVSVDDSSVIEISNQFEGSKRANQDSVKQTPDAGKVDQMDTDQGKETRSQSLSLSSFMDEHKHNEGYLGIGRCSCMITERGEKRTAEYIDDEAVIKKPREWDMSGVTQMHDYLHPSHSTMVQEEPAVENIGPATGSESMPHKIGEEVIEYAEEMQPFPGSFKICDLNTVDASQRNEILVPGPTLLLPSIAENKNEVDLSANNNSGISSTYTRRGADGKEIEVINLDDDCLQVDNVFESSERKEDTVFMGSASFPDHAQIVNDISGVQDGYDLMMSDFLGNDIAGSGNVNSLQNDVALDNGQEILGDDESIYMSLGEIPISMPEI